VKGIKETKNSVANIMRLLTNCRDFRILKSLHFAFFYCSDPGICYSEVPIKAGEGVFYY
jgi:hypothetical protein